MRVLRDSEGAACSLRCRDRLPVTFRPAQSLQSQLLQPGRSHGDAQREPDLLISSASAMRLGISILIVAGFYLLTSMTISVSEACGFQYRPGRQPVKYNVSVLSRTSFGKDGDIANI